MTKRCLLLLSFLAAGVAAQDDAILWAGRTVIPDRSTGAPPALAVLEGKLHLVYRGETSRILYHSVFDGGRWSTGKVIPNAKSKTTPGLAVLGKTLHIVHRGRRDEQLYHTRYEDGAWRAHTLLADRMSRDAPALCAVGDKLHIVYVGKSKNRLYHSTYNGTIWSAEKPIDHYPSISRPSLAVHQGRLHVAYLGSKGKNRSDYPVFVGTLEAGEWTVPRKWTGVRSTVAPALVTHGTRMLAFTTGGDGVIHWSPYTGTDAAEVRVVPGQASRGTPAVASTNGQVALLHLVYRGKGKHTLWYAVGGRR